MGCRSPRKESSAGGLGDRSTIWRSTVVASSWPSTGTGSRTGGPLRARDILTILQEGGTSFISKNPVYSVVGALNVARENGWVVKKGRGWWQAASRGGVGSGGGAEGGEGVAQSDAGDGLGSRQ